MSDPMSAFVVEKIIPLQVFGIDISITNSSLYMMLTVALIGLLFWIGTSRQSVVPSKMQVLLEKMFFFVGNLVKTNAGRSGVVLFPYMLALFLFIMFGNVLGLFPYAFSFTSQLVVTVGMALLVFLSSIVVGVVKQGFGYLKHFCPKGIPFYLIPFFIIIEVMSFVFRPISLGIRLFANMVAGHIMIKVIAGFAVSIASITFASIFSVVPVAVNIFLNVFKLVVCMLQAYVFVVLSCMYLSESLEESSH